MMKHTVILQEYKKEGLNGDRATKTTPYSDYIVVIEAADGQRFNAKKFSGYDSFMCHVEDTTATRNCADKYARDLADFLCADVRRVTMIEKKVTITEWVEETK